MTADTQEARALLESRPSTKAWLAARDQAWADRESRLQAGHEAAARNAPQTFLTNLRGRGIDVQLTHGGSLILPPGIDMTLLNPSELAGIKLWKPELVAILQAEADAAKAARSAEPIVLA